MRYSVDKLPALDVEIRRDPSVKREKRKIIVVKGDKEVYFKDIEYFTPLEIQKLIDETADDYYRLAYMLYYETGSMFREARVIKFEDLDIANKKLKIGAYAYALKDMDVFRYVNLSDRLVSLIVSHKAANNLSDSDLILTKVPGDEITMGKDIVMHLLTDMKNILGRDYSQKVSKYSDYVNNTLVLFRHSKAIHMLDAGVNILDVQAFFKHARPVTTARYLRYSKVGMEQAMKTNPELFMTKWVY